jgi:succinoglycan biosynthesis transport protein ExoP
MNSEKNRRLKLGDINAKMEPEELRQGPLHPPPEPGSATQAQTPRRRVFDLNVVAPFAPVERAGTQTQPPPQQPAPAAKSEPAAPDSTVASPVPVNPVAETAPKPPVSAPSEAAPPHPVKLDEEDEEQFDVFKYIAIVMRRKGIVILTMMVLAVISIFSYLKSEKLYPTTARLLFRPNGQNVLGDNTMYYYSDERSKELNTHLELLKSSIVLDRVAENLDNRVTAGGIRGKLTIKQGETAGEKNNIIELGYSHPEPDIARDVLNELCRTYIDYHREVSSQEDTRLIVKLKAQIEKLQSSLTEKENTMRQFKETHLMTGISEETSVIINKLSNIEVALQETQIALLEAKERLVGLRSQIGQQEINVIQSMTYNNPFQSKISELELQLSTLAAEYSPDHFKVVTVKQQIEKLKLDMQTQITAEAASKTFVKNPIRQDLLSGLVDLTISTSALETKRIAQEQIRDQLNAQMQGLPKVEQEYAFLQRESESILYTLRVLKTKFEEVKIQRDSRESDLKIFELSKTPESSFSSKSISTVFLGLIIGLILGIALAFLIDYMDQTIKEPMEVERTLEVPLLGVVPLMDNQRIINVSPDEKSSRNQLEPFRALRANLNHLLQQNDIRKLMLCSAIKGEGKTTLAINLAITFAMDGKKVILIDADLRRSQVHHYLSVPKEIGLFDYLAANASIEEIIKPTPYENLFIITSGARPDNPAELLGTPRFSQLVDVLPRHADLVFFDSPAFLPVSDSIIMAPKMDAVIMVVRARWTPIKAAAQTKSQLKRINSRIIGAIYNGVSHSQGYYPYYYGYYGYYSYRYAYSYEEDGKQRPSLREWGLKVEDAIKVHLRQTIHSVPRYLDVAANFSRYILSRKFFWLLLVLLLALIGSRLYLRSSDTNESGLTEYITRIDAPPHKAAAGGGIALEGFTEPVIRSEIIMPSDSSPLTDSLTVPLSEKAQTHADGRTSAAVSVTLDSLAAWMDAINNKNAVRTLGFYDREQFRFPNGTFDDWEPVCRQRWFADTGRDSILCDTLWGVAVREGFVETHLRGGYGTMESHAECEWTMIWRQTREGWHIIREKEEVRR